MKVLFLIPSLVHYYNLVLSKLGEDPGCEVVVVIALGRSRNVGDGVFETQAGASFRVWRLPERGVPYVSSWFGGLARVLWHERPEIAVVPEPYFLSFMLNPLLAAVVRFLDIKLVMQSIPFQLPKYPEALARLRGPWKPAGFLPAWLRLPLQTTGLHRIARRAYLELRRVAFLRADAHLNYVDDAVETFGSYGVAKQRIFVAYNSPDTDTYRAVEGRLAGAPPVLPPNSNRVIHVGRLVPWKRVDLLLAAIARLRKEFHDIELVVVGQGPEEESLRAIAKSLGIDDVTRFVGGVYETHELARYFRASSVYVLAGMGGLSINDAMFFGLPIVCSVCDGTEKKLVRDGFNGFFFAEGDLEDLASKIRCVLADPEKRAEMGKNSRRIIDQEVNIHSVLARYRACFTFVATERKP